MRHFSFAIFLLISTLSFAQKGIIRGTVIDDATGEIVIGATVKFQNNPGGAISDLDGAFSITTDPGIYNVVIFYVSYQDLTIENVEVKADEVTLLGEIRISENSNEIGGVVVTATQKKNSEAAIITMKRKSPVIFDGISAAKIKLVGDGTAVEAAKRVTGVSVEDGKYVYIRGLGDRYTKTTLNNMELPGLDPDKNSIQLDIFPTNMISNILVSKNFTAEQPADFTGGILNVETTAFPDKPISDLSVGIGYNPAMHFNKNNLAYKGGKTDFLGFDDGTRALPDQARSSNVPTPISGASRSEVRDFITSFSPTLGAERKTSLMDYSLSYSLGNQISLDKEGEDLSGKKLGYVVSLSYKNDYKYFSDVTYGEYQRFVDPEMNEMRYATIQTGEIGEQSRLVGLLGGVAYKTNTSKISLTAVHLQSGTSRAGIFFIDNDGQAVGQSGYFALSHNLEYNQRSLSNVMLTGSKIDTEKKFNIDWKLSSTLSVSNDPDIRKTAFTYEADTNFVAGGGGNPARIWRYLNEQNYMGRVDFEKEYKFMARNGKFKFGASQLYKVRDYEILFFDVQFFGSQKWTNYDPNSVLDTSNLFPNRPNGIYYQSGNNDPNPNAYNSNVLNSAAYVSNEFEVTSKLKTILGLRAEYFVQRHTGRNQSYASGDVVNGKNLVNEKVLESLDLFPSVNIIYGVTEAQNLRFTYGRTIARPSFKELSFAQIIDPITNRIFNGSLFTYSDWDGKLVETRVNNLDFRWEYFFKEQQMVSASFFFKSFDKPIEMVRIPEQQTSTEFQPRNVGDGQLLGVELELRKHLGFISEKLKSLEFNTNVTLVESSIDMTDLEFNSRKGYEKLGETIQNTRAMAGQSPYVINAGFSYSTKESGWNTGLFYNVKGPTLYIVGAGLFPDVYFNPFHSLNFSLNKTLGEDEKSSIEFKASNILNQSISYVYKSYEAQDQPFTTFNPGSAFSFGYSYKF